LLPLPLAAELLFHDSPVHLLRLAPLLSEPRLRRRPLASQPIVLLRARLPLGLLLALLLVEGFVLGVLLALLLVELLALSVLLALLLVEHLALGVLLALLLILRLTLRLGLALLLIHGLALRLGLALLLLIHRLTLRVLERGRMRQLRDASVHRDHHETRCSETPGCFHDVPSPFKETETAPGARELF
jgi:hypothetical protein